MRFKFRSFARTAGEQNFEDNRWRCGLCCHVRTGTIALGIWHLGIQLLSLAAIGVLVLNPHDINQKTNTVNRAVFADNNVDQDPSSILPTPLSAEIHEEPHALPILETGSSAGLSHHDKQTTDSPKVIYSSFVYKDWFGEHSTAEQQANYQDLNVSVGVNFCTLGITLLMIYGAVRGKSLYLMPFFCLQAFDFFVSSLSVIGYLSYVPDIRQVVIKTPNIPLRNELLAMDPQCLSLLILAGILLTLMAKLYFINVVWNCYKYLTLRAEAAHERDSCIPGVIDDQNLLEIPLSSVSPGSDLPDYATAMTDPRFAKKPIYPTPPPPYATVVSHELEAEVHNTTSAGGPNSREAQIP